MSSGPISTGLRRAAEQTSEWVQDDLDVYGWAAVTDYENGNELGYAWSNLRHAPELHRSLFLLILAEAIADEGM